MKKLIRAATYKDNDPRLPLIKSIENVLGLRFNGSKPGMQYCKIYDCYLECNITSKQDAYKLQIYQSSTTDREIAGSNYKYADPTILMDIANYLEINYNEYFIKVDKKYGFVLCKPYFSDLSTLDEGEDIAKELSHIVFNSLYSDQFKYPGKGPEFSSYKSYENYVKLIWTWHADEKSLKYASKYIQDVITNEGYRIKSASTASAPPTGYGRPYYPERIIISVFYR